MEDLQIIIMELAEDMLRPGLRAGMLEPMREREQERSRYKLTEYTLHVQEVGGAVHGVRPRLHQWTNQRTFIGRAA